MSASDFIKTKASSSVNKNFQTVVYESYKPKEKRKKNEEPIKIESNNYNKISENEFNIKKARHEIIKFGISGFDSSEKQKANVQLAIKLGAKPPKNKYINYKNLLNEQKQKKSKEEMVNQLQQIGKNSMGKSIAKGKSFDRKRKKAAVSGLLDVYGKATLKNKFKNKN